VSGGEHARSPRGGPTVGVSAQVKSRSRWFRAIQAALLGSVFLTGCPSIGDFGGAPNPVAAFTVKGIQGDDVCTTPPNRDELVVRALELVNQERQKRGLHALTPNPLLSKIAQDYCCEMIEGAFFDHINPFTLEGPGQRAMNAGYGYFAIGENLAGGQTSPEQAMQEWMASTLGHRENILSPQWREVGIGVKTGGQFGVYWVQLFGNPLP
jgi:uncharacterized protein YkwD